MSAAAEDHGRAVLAEAARLARELWGARLCAAYALGSLAHGGFSALVSDVDLGLILEGPLDGQDAERVRRLSAGVVGAGRPLSDRLSVFWGTRETLTAGAAGGRFPPLDRLDLIQYGQLLEGQDAREGLPRPSRRELVTASARLGLDLLSRPSHQAWLADPANLLLAEPKPLTKAILFPVRFLYTARTGEIGRNHDAVRHIVQAEPGPAGDLAAAALRWRDEPPVPDDGSARALIEAGFRPIYQLFAADHQARMAAWGETELAERLAAAGRQLASLSAGVSAGR
jgi:hypothetical protein